MLKKVVSGLIALNLLMGSQIVFGNETGSVISKANIRNEGSLTGSVIGSLEKDTKVDIIEKVNDWYKISYNNKEAYIYEKLVNNTNEDNIYKNKQLLSTYETYYSLGDKNRNHNIEYSSVKNSIVLNPGETFSFNNNCNRKADDANYKLAGIIVNKRLVKGYGGGICQVSSTIYNAVLKVKGLEITERHTHSLTVGYVPKGKDATVNRGTADLKFKNNLEYPIYLECISNHLNGQMKVNIYK